MIGEILVINEGDVFYIDRDPGSKKGVWVKIKKHNHELYAIDMNPKRPHGITRAFPIRDSICYMNEAIDASILN